MSFLDFIVLALAGRAFVEVWFNGSIFADWRAFFQTKADEEDTLPAPAQDDDVEDAGTPLPFVMRLADRCIPRLGAELLSCSFCFSHHTPWILATIFFLPAIIIDHEIYSWLFKLPVYSLAATQLGKIFADE